MGQHINLPTSGTQCIGAYLARPEGKPRGGIVVIQEIFGVNAHIRSVADRLAAAGYVAVAPQFFDYLESGVEMDYNADTSGRGKALVNELGMDRAVEAVGSAAESIASAGKIGTVGFCWGGTVALLAAIRLGLPSVSYYGARNLPFLDEPPMLHQGRRAPVMFHFGELDKSIPPEMVARHREKLPQMEIYSYPADHAFNRDIGVQYHEPSATLAWDRSMGFFARELAGA